VSDLVVLVEVVQLIILTLRIGLTYSIKTNPVLIFYKYITIQPFLKADEFTREVLNDICLKLVLPRDDDGPYFTRVTKRWRDADGILTGMSPSNSPTFEFMALSLPVATKRNLLSTPSRKVSSKLITNFI